jgi:ABC-type tungstate transport system substrate-binding protein
VGFAAANIEVRAFKVACIPAFVMLMVCCSIASCIATYNGRKKLVLKFSHHNEKSGLGY